MRLFRLASRVVQAQIKLGDYVTGSHTWYERMAAADRRNFALMTYAALGSVTFFLFGILLVILGNLIPVLRIAPVALLVFALFGGFLLCLALFVVVSVGGAFGMIIRSRPKP